MKYIETTSVHVEMLRAVAEANRVNTGKLAAVALDEVARAAGYRTWSHVLWCAAETNKRLGAVTGVDAVGRVSAAVAARRAERLEKIQALAAQTFPAGPMPRRASERGPLIRAGEAYLEAVREKAAGAGPVRSAAIGNAFHVIEVEGSRFIGFATVYAIRLLRLSSVLDDHDRGHAPLGLATMQWATTRRGAVRRTGWHVCGGGPNDPRIWVDDLTIKARHAVAHEFGLPIVKERSRLHDKDPHGHPHPRTLFYLSPAFKSLCALAKQQPEQARSWRGNAYLGCWGEAARAGRAAWDLAGGRRSGRW
ncbi:MAG: hypothetical protein MUC42_14835 [Bryobacter sp.]|jgi:hypothetical protein|nr:hypothetical protein [Bryobacter sp.]